MLIFCLRLTLISVNKETQFHCAMLVLERNWEEKSHLHVLFQLPGGPCSSSPFFSLLANLTTEGWECEYLVFIYVYILTFSRD